MKTAEQVVSEDAFAESTERGKPPEMTVTYFAVIPHYWGKGKDEKEARKNLRQAGPRAALSHRELRILTVEHEKRTVVSFNDMGGLSTFPKKKKHGMGEEELWKAFELTKVIERRNRKGQKVDEWGDRILDTTKPEFV